MADEDGITEDATTDETSTDAGQEQKSFSDLSADEKVEFLLAKTRRLEDQTKGKSGDAAARAQAKRVKELEKQVAEANELKAALEEASQTEAERAIKKANEDGAKAGREAALAEARKTYGSQLVNVKLDAAAERKGMTTDQIRRLAGEPSRFLDDDGVDDAALKDWIDALPDKATEPARLTPNALGGGRREGAKLSAFEAGIAASQARRQKTTT